MKRIVRLLVSTLLMAGFAGAQESRSTIIGHVKDGQGAVVAGATILVVNTDTGATVRLSSNEVGAYEAPLLIPGAYTVSAELSGFKKTVRSGITLQVSDRREVELILEIGAITESVSVTGEAPIVDVTRTDSGRVLDSRSVQDLPAMANTVLTMIPFSAGVQSGIPALLGPHSTQGASDYNSGTGIGGNEWTIDGATANGNSRYVANVPSVEAVAETKVLTTTFDGSFGHSTGIGIVIMTKTGTNQFHGSATETYWSQRWQGSPFFAKQSYYRNIASLRAQGKTAEADAAADKPIQLSGHSNLWTFNLTGPIWIPKIFDGRNKMFFSFNYQGQKDAKPEEASTYNRIVPTADNKKGDFSDLLKVSVSPQNYQLYDPLSVKVDPNRSGHYLRTAIPGNVLPASYINMGKKFYDPYLKYWPDPNNWFDKSIAPTTNPFLSVDAPYNWEYSSFSGRMDTNIGEKLRTFGRYSQNHFFEYRGDWTVGIVRGLNNGNNGTGGGSGTVGVWRDDQNGVLDMVYTVTPRTIFHASGALSNWSSRTATPDFAFQFKPTDVGLPSYLDQKCGDQCYLPLMGIAGYSTNGSQGIPAPVYNRFWTENADLYHNRRNHSFRFGLDVRQQTRSIHNGNNNGQYTFNNTYFRQCDDNCGSNYSAATIGLSWASYMMGLPTGISISGNDSAIVSAPYYAGFAMDTWRVNPKLTLTLSLRWEYELGPLEKHQRQIIDYDSNASLPISSLAEAAYAKSPLSELPASQFKVRGGAIYATTSGARKRAWDSQLMWLPRIGFGYQLDSKTVVRGGYGIYYDTLNVNAVSYGPDQTGYSRGTNTTVTSDNGVNWLVGDPKNLVSPLNDPFPVRAANNNTRFDVPLRDALGNMARFGNGWTFPADRHPRQQRWRIGIERQIGAVNVVEVAYEGTYTTDINVNNNLSSVPSTFYDLSPARTRNATIDGLNGANVTSPFAFANFASLAATQPVIYADMATKSGTTYAGTITKANLIRAFPNANVTIPSPIGKSRSQQITASFNRRFSKGLTANFAYTGMVTKAATGFYEPWSGFDPVNPQVLYWQRQGASPHRVVATWVYDMPFGRGRSWGHHWLVSALAGGWTVSGTYQYNQGGLVGFGNNFYYGDPKNIQIADPTIGHYFDTTGCVASAAAAGPGDTVITDGSPCTKGWEKRSGFGPATYQRRFFESNIDGLRGMNTHQLNGSLRREFRVKERITFEVRGDVINVLNRSSFQNPNTTPSSQQFGQITTNNGVPMRFPQVTGRIRW